jgi:hypothetical protein
MESEQQQQELVRIRTLLEDNDLGWLTQKINNEFTEGDSDVEALIIPFSIYN